MRVSLLCVSNFNTEQNSTQNFYNVIAIPHTNQYQVRLASQ